MHSPPKDLLQTIINGHHDAAVVEALRLSCEHAGRKNPDWMWSCVDDFFWLAKLVNDKEVCLRVFKVLQDAGMPMTAQGANGKTAAHDASAGAIRALAEMGDDVKSVFHTHDNNGINPLTWQCSIDASWPGFAEEQLRNVQAIEALLDAGAHIDSTCGQMGKTPLMHIGSNTRIHAKVQKQLILLLIDRGANTRARDHNVHDLLHHLNRSSSDPSIALELIDQGLDATRPQLEEGAKVCVIKSDAANLERFLRMGLEPVPRMPLLEYACRYGATSCCAKLLEYGWVPSNKDMDLTRYYKKGEGCAALIQAWQAKKQAMEALDSFSNQTAPARQSAKRQGQGQ